MEVERELGKDVLPIVRQALLDLRRVGFESLLYREASDINFKQDSDLNSYALERADIQGFVRAIKVIFEEINHG